MVSDIGREFEGAKFGDQRLDARAGKIVAKLSVDPSKSFPYAMITESETEAFYRFLRNERVTGEKILTPHFMETAQRARQVGVVLVVHDSTEVALTSDAESDFYQLSSKTYGYLAHVSLAVSVADGLPLGLAGLAIPRRQK